MNCCVKRCISIITLIIAVIIFIQTNLLTIMIFNLKNNSLETLAKTNEQKTDYENSKQQITYNDTEEEWKLIIPKLNLSTTIKEGTSAEIINNYIGHFEETPKDNGNIGLIAASAGYKENYFKDLKDLVAGDVIIYIKGNVKKEYKVTTNMAISQTDWSYLSNTQDDRLTLITGILEQPEQRRCVQAVEIMYG